MDERTNLTTNGEQHPKNCTRGIGVMVTHLDCTHIRKQQVRFLHPPLTLKKQFIMTKQEYLDAIESIKAQIKEKNEAINQLTTDYVDANKPCELETLVKITRESGRVTIGHVKSFGILNDKSVYVTAIKPEKGAQQYISQPYKSIEIL